MKYVQRKRIYRALRIARIAPIELKARMDAGEGLTIVDLRNSTEWQEGRIPGSIQLTDNDLDSRLASTAGSEIVLYCSCPNEFTSARAANGRSLVPKNGVGEASPSHPRDTQPILRAQFHDRRFLGLAQRYFPDRTYREVLTTAGLIRARCLGCDTVHLS
jgi:rhodanese-related sulfurtransferase